MDQAEHCPLCTGHGTTSIGLGSSTLPDTSAIPLGDQLLDTRDPSQGNGPSHVKTNPCKGSLCPSVYRRRLSHQQCTTPSNGRIDGSMNRPCMRRSPGALCEAEKNHLINVLIDHCLYSQASSRFHSRCCCHSCCCRRCRLWNRVRLMIASLVGC